MKFNFEVPYAYAYAECSARTMEGVREDFETATIAALQVKKL